MALDGETKEIGDTSALELNELPSNPQLRQELKDGIDQIVASMIRMQAEKTLQSEALTNLQKKTGVKKKLINRYARWKFKGTAREEATEVSNAEAAFEILFNGAAEPAQNP